MGMGCVEHKGLRYDAKVRIATPLSSARNDAGRCGDVYVAATADADGGLVAAAYWPPPFLCTGAQIATGLSALAMTREKERGSQRLPLRILRCSRTMTRHPFCSYPQDRLCRAEDCFFTERSLPPVTKILTLRFLCSETPQSFSKKRSLFPLRFSQKRKGKS